MRAEGIFDVDANTSIDQLSEDLNIKMPEVCNCFTAEQLIIVPSIIGFRINLDQYRNFIC